jgi:hypothetical protein
MLQRSQLAMTYSGFEPGAYIHDAALTNKLSMGRNFTNRLDLVVKAVRYMHAPGSNPGQVIERFA